MSVRYDGATGDTAAGTETRNVVAGHCPCAHDAALLIGQGKVQ
jgi:hypothetical protein